MSNHTPSRASGVRRGPRKQDHFTILDNDVINDERLSFRARGILAYILSKPADWRTSAAALARVTKEGRDACGAGLNELRAHGYMVTEKIQDPETGRWSTVSTVYEVPVETERSPVPPSPGKGSTGKPGAGNSGDNQRTDHEGKKLTTTQPAERKPRKARAKSPVVVGSTSDERLKPLADACLDKGLPAAWGTLSREKADAIAELVDVHGVQVLVDHAVKMHTPANPTRHAGGLLITWQSLPLPRPTAAPKCDECDEYGWLGEDSEGRPIKCSCRSTARVAA